MARLAISVYIDSSQIQIIDPYNSIRLWSMGLKEKTMMYAQHVAMAIRANGRILRENNDIVHLPFGAEYSVFIRNMNSVRLQFKLQIDGTDVTEGTWIIVAPNSSIDMERFIKNGNWNQGNKFKFIERTAQVEAHRGIGAEDGLVRLEFQKELVPVYTPPPVWDRRTPPGSPWDRRNPPYKFSGGLRSSGPRGVRYSAISGQNVNSSTSSLGPDSYESFGGGGAAGAAAPGDFEEAQIGEAGITVEGSKSNQQFVSVASFTTEAQVNVMILHLKGQVAGQPVVRPVTVQQKLTCSSCGTLSRSNAQFCNQCGTSLISFA